MENDIIISFAEEDMDHVTALQQQLNQELASYRIVSVTRSPDDRAVSKAPHAWIYPNQPGGIEFEPEIYERIKQAPTVIVIVTTRSADSDWVFRESRRALQDGRNIVVVAWGNKAALLETSLGKLLGHLHWIDFPSPSASYSSEVQAVISSLGERRIIERKIFGNDPIELQERVTQRAYGGIWKGMRLRDKHPVIIKEVVSSRREVLQELDDRIPKRRNSPHLSLPDIYTYIQEGDQRLVVMEDVGGRSLADLINARDQPLRWEELRSWAEDALRTLVAMHHQKMFHLGLRPHNLKWHNDRVRLVDIGFDEQPGTTRGGTPDPYLAPEQLTRSIADARTDIYALGATLYTALTGDWQPSRGKLLAHELIPNVPKHISLALHQAMERDPLKRFQSAEEMLSALREPVHYPPPPPPPPPPLLPRPTPGWMLVAAGAAALAVILLIGAAIYIRPAANTPTAGVPPAAPTAALVASAVPESAAPEPLVPEPTTPIPPSATTAALPTPAPTLLPPTLEVAVNENPCPGVDVAAAAPGAIPVTIAVAVPLTGNDDVKGIAMVNAACMAFKQLQSTLAPTYTLRLASFDDRGDSTHGAAVAQAVLDHSTTACVVGHRSSNVSLAALRDYEGQIIMISPSNSNPNVTSNFTISFRLAGNDEGQAAAALAFLLDPNEDLAQRFAAPRVLIIHDTATYASTLKDIFTRRAEQRGVSIIGTIGFEQQDPTNPTKLRALVGQLPDSASYDVIYLAASSVEDALELIGGIRLREVEGQTKPIIITDALDSPQLKQPQDLRDVYLTTMAMPPDLLGQFATDYVRRFGGSSPVREDIPAYTAESYDATLMCIQAIRASGPTPDITALRQRVIAAKLLPQRYERDYQADATVTGPYEYGADRGFVKGGYYFVRNLDEGRVTTEAKYNCGEQPSGGCTPMQVDRQQ